jgi:transcriptional regulator with XRE-family HTH domain
MTRKRKMTLRAYVTQRGLFARVARKLRIDPSYVSRVANGKRHNDRISQAIEADLNKKGTGSRKARNKGGSGHPALTT